MGKLLKGGYWLRNYSKLISGSVRLSPQGQKLGQVGSGWLSGKKKLIKISGETEGIWNLHMELHRGFGSIVHDIPRLQCLQSRK